MSSSFTHDPQAVLDYTWDWSPWLADGETITAATVTPTSDAVTVSDVGHDDTTVTAWVTATGTERTTVRLRCHIVTSADRADDRTITVSITDR